MTTVPNTILMPGQILVSRLDTYKYAGAEPVLYRNVRDDVAEIIEAARRLGYNYYLYRGLVMQLTVETGYVGLDRYFVSFYMTNDARQNFWEASSTHTVYSKDHKHEFLRALAHNVSRRG